MIKDQRNPNQSYHSILSQTILKNLKSVRKNVPQKGKKQNLSICQ